MSRCFPFPPPGYMRNGSCGEALIESIKLQRDAEKAKKDLKEQKRREKKEKKKAKKAKKENQDGKEHKHREKEKREKKKEKKDAASHSIVVKDHKIIEQERSGCLQKVDDYSENELLERSDITKELDQPYSGHEPCCSDSTQSSNKRKRSTSPSSQDHGTVIKLRFSLKKHKGPEESKAEAQVGSSRNVKNECSLAKDKNGSHQTAQRLQNVKRDQCVEHSDSKPGEKLQDLQPETAPSTNKSNDACQGMLSPYNSLFQNWVPLPLAYSGLELDDQDWLFCSQKQKEPTSKPVTASLQGCSSTSLWPRAQYLSEVEMYALPYTVPF